MWVIVVYVLAAELQVFPSAEGGATGTVAVLVRRWSYGSDGGVVVVIAFDGRRVFGGDLTARAVVVAVPVAVGVASVRDVMAAV